jgi:hypothetical protein
MTGVEELPGRPFLSAQEPDELMPAGRGLIGKLVGMLMPRQRKMMS